jgi:hypothetical protein
MKLLNNLGPDDLKAASAMGMDPEKIEMLLALFEASSEIVKNRNTYSMFAFYL